jgi:UDP-glucose 4-epimerase
MDNKEKVLITGGAGFIGLHVIPKLLDMGFAVRVFDSMTHRGDRMALEELVRDREVELVEQDVRYGAAVAEAMEGCSYAVHLAAVSINKSLADPFESLDINVMGSQNVIAAAANQKVKKLIFASSASVYGDPKKLPMSETDELNPVTPYCISKRAVEDLLSMYGRTKQLKWVSLRFFNVYGPGQKTSAYYTSVINHFVSRLKNGEPPVIDGKGDQSMDFVHVEDIANAIVASLSSDVTNEVFNVGTGVSTSIANLAQILIDAVGVNVEPIFNERQVLVTRRAADISKITKMLNWTPTIDVQSGMKALINS